MSLLFEISFNWANVLATFLFLFCIGYWVTVILGVLDFSAIDIDIDFDLDSDVNPEMDSGGEMSVGWLNHVLLFFNLGKVPFMIWFTILTLAAWIITVDVNFIIGNTTFIIGLPIYLGAVFVSAFVAKLVTQPFLKFFISIQQNDLKVDLTGSIGIVKLPILKGSKGQLIVKKDGSTHIISAFIEEDGIEINKGDKALIISKDSNSNAFLVQAYND